MSSNFSFADSQDAEFPQEAMPSTMVLGDIEKVMRSEETGNGKVLPDHSIRIEYSTFVIVSKPDGSFHGYRKASVNAPVA
jgi:hypothetical protein